MEIYTKFMSGGPTESVSVARIYQTLDRIFAYAAEVLGDNYSYTVNTDTDPQHADFLFTDPTGSGTHGWRMWKSEGEFVPTIMSCGEQHTSFKTLTNVCTELTDFTAMVWKTSGGSVGIGYREIGGTYQTCFLLIKFEGKYDGTDVYGVTCNYGASGHGPLVVHGHTDIGLVNHCCNSDIGSGVYLHPLFDPISGCVSSDVFGVQSMGYPGYAANGTIVKQGETSYLSVLGGPHPANANADNHLFVKM